MRKTTIALMTALAIVGATEANAQTSASASAGITIPTLLKLTVTNTTVTFGSPTFTDYDAGEIGMSSAATVIDTRGNVSHDVQIAAGGANMTYTGSHTPAAKPVSDLQWSTDGATWTGLSTTATNVATALARGTNAGAATVQYKMLLDAVDDMPGDYDVSFTYTIVAN